MKRKIKMNEETSLVPRDVFSIVPGDLNYVFLEIPQSHIFANLSVKTAMHETE